MKLRKLLKECNINYYFKSTIGGYFIFLTKSDKNMGKFGKTKYIALLKLARYTERYLISIN